MAFASIHIPGFLIQAAVRSEPMLRNRALVLLDGTPPLWTVIAANDAALQTGIQLGMTKSQAAQFCTIEMRHRSQPQEKAAHAALLDLGWSMSPHIEDTAPDTILVDIAGLASLLGSVKNIANELVGRAFSLGLTANVAIASCIEAALLASRGFAGITLIPPGEEAQRLGELPVNVLPVSRETLEILERWGVRICAALAALPLLEVSERLGQEGVRLHELARGANRRSLVLAQTSLFFEEGMVLDDCIEELEPLSFILGRLLDQLCARLNARSLAAHSIRVCFELEAAFKNDIQRLRVDSPRTATAHPAKTYEKSLNLPVPMRDSKMLLQLLRLQLQSAPPAAPILKITLSAQPARPRATQGGLFLPSSPDPEKLELTVARLASLVGDSNIGSPELVDTHRPGEFRIGRFHPSSTLPETRNNLSGSPRHKKSKKAGAFSPQAQPHTEINQDATTNPESGRRPFTAFRAFRPVLPAKVDLRDLRPARISFNGLSASVIAASGPWRTSGDWWREDTWQQDEWDLELRFGTASHANCREQTARTKSLQNPQHGVYCIYFDASCQGWFVRGIYD
jgi:protein ImuB